MGDGPPSKTGRGGEPIVDLGDGVIDLPRGGSGCCLCGLHLAGESFLVLLSEATASVQEIQRGRGAEVEGREGEEEDRICNKKLWQVCTCLNISPAPETRADK